MVANCFLHQLSSFQFFWLKKNTPKTPAFVRFWSRSLPSGPPANTTCHHKVRVRSNTPGDSRPMAVDVMFVSLKNFPSFCCFNTKKSTLPTKRRGFWTPKNGVQPKMNLMKWIDKHLRLREGKKMEVSRKKNWRSPMIQFGLELNPLFWTAKG